MTAPSCILATFHFSSSAAATVLKDKKTETAAGRGCNGGVWLDAQEVMYDSVGVKITQLYSAEPPFSPLQPYFGSFSANQRPNPLC